ncbi:alpha/beta fold hydrolase [Microbacterium sp. cf046]|uniref:alpha/beta fold hydrolase n=1 Tax=Microbacterium sp. cf046 TaxID=1761803 RepID=UPI001587C091|nr:alpha/beta hydrolase [Microbacterium sp. cf046]
MSTARGAAIGFDVFGEPDAPPMVIIQGFSAQRIGWPTGLCEALSDRGFRVVRFDNRDTGQSERYPAGGYSLVDLARDTLALLDDLGLESAHIVGQSMGGMIAQLVATIAPSRVRSLGLLYTTASTRHFVDVDDAVARIEAPQPSTRAEFIAAYLISEANCASTAYPQDTAWLADLGGQMWDRGVDQDGVNRQLAALLAFPDAIDAARTISVPTAIIAGDADRLISFRASEELHAAIPGSTLRIFPGMGHEVPGALWGEIAGIVADNARRAERQRA